MASFRTRGVTLIELLVVIFIVGLVVAILVMAVQHSRETARRVACGNNVRQLSMAMLNFASLHRDTLPNSGTFFSDRELGFSLDTQPVLTWGAPKHSWVVDLLPFIERPKTLENWDLKRPFNDPGDDGVFNEDDASNYALSQTSIDVLCCPDDPTLQTGKGNLSYVVNGGFTYWWGCPMDGLTGFLGTGHWMDFDGNGVISSTCGGTAWTNNSLDGDRSDAADVGLLWPGTTGSKTKYERPRRIADITDGTSHTLLLSENMYAGYATYTWQGSLVITSSWANPDPNFCAFRVSDDVCPNGDCRLLDRSKANSTEARDNAYHYSENINGLLPIQHSLAVLGGSGTTWPYLNSMHPGGVNAAYCDGSVRFLSQTIDGGAFMSLVTPRGNRLRGPLAEMQ